MPCRDLDAYNKHTPKSRVQSGHGQSSSISIFLFMASSWP